MWLQLQLQSLSLSSRHHCIAVATSPWSSDDNISDLTSRHSLTLFTRLQPARAGVLCIVPNASGHGHANTLLTHFNASHLLYRRRIEGWRDEGASRYLCRSWILIFEGSKALISYFKLPVDENCRPRLGFLSCTFHHWCRTGGLLLAPIWRYLGGYSITIS
jgi:hypothetical protein